MVSELDVAVEEVIMNLHFAREEFNARLFEARRRKSMPVGRFNL
jgi:hypothetical protein